MLEVLGTLFKLITWITLILEYYHASENAEISTGLYFYKGQIQEHSHYECVPNVIIE